MKVNKKSLLRSLIPLSCGAASLLLLFAFLILLGCAREDEISAKYGTLGPVSFQASSFKTSSGTKSSSEPSSAESSAPIFGEDSTSLASDCTFEIDWDWDIPVEDDAKGLADTLSQSSDTRFSGQVFEITTNQYSERLDWIAGDKVTVAETVSGRSCEYKASPSSTSEQNSVAGLSPVNSGEVLKWTYGQDHKFISLYPSLPVMGLDNSSLTLSGSSATVSGRFDAMPSIQYNYRSGGRRYKGVNTTSATGDYEIWYEPDMKYAYMTASAEVPASAIPSEGAPMETVSLPFSPCFNSVEVKLRKPNAYHSTTVQLESAVLRAGSGSGTDIEPLNVTLSGGDADIQMSSSSGLNFTAGAGSGGSNEVTLYFRNSKTATQNSYPALSSSTPLSFTFLTLPVDISQLELQLNLLVGTKRVPRSATLKLQTVNSGVKNWIRLSKGKKLTISNLRTGGLDTLFVVPDTVHIYANSTLAAASAPFSITSYRENTNGSKTRLGFTAKFSMSEDGPWYADNDKNMPEDLKKIVYGYTDSKLEYAAGSNWDAATGEVSNRHICVRGQDFSRILTMDRQIRKDLLSSRPANGYTEDAPQDLSQMNTLTGEMRTGDGNGNYRTKTANCYIIQRGGWYMLPCVYGNSFDYEPTKGGSNPDPCNSASYNSVAYGNYTFPAYNHANAIKTFDATSSRSYSHGAGPIRLSRPIGMTVEDFMNNFEAVIVWQQESGNDRWLSIPEGSTTLNQPGSGLCDFEMGQDVMNAAQNTEYTTPITWYDKNKTAYQPGRPVYIKFKIDETKIAEGNAVIALREKASYNSQQRIVWSWHIWVTAENLFVDQINLYPQESRTERNRLLNVPLGWVQGATYYYPERQFYMKLTQKNTNLEGITTVIQHYNEYPTGSATFYQWGRKDPMLSAWLREGYENGSIDGCWGGGGYDTRVNNVNTQYYALVRQTASFYNANKFPYKFCMGGDGDNNVGWYANSGTALYNNLWDTGAGQQSSSVSVAYQLDTLPITNRNIVKSIYDPCPPGFHVPPANFLFGAHKARYNTNTGYQTKKWNLIWEKGSDLMGDGGLYIRRYPEDTEGYFLPALGTYNYSTGYHGRTMNQYCYWTAAGYRLVGQYMDYDVVPAEEHTYYSTIGYAFMAGHKTADATEAAMNHMFKVFQSLQCTYAAPVIPWKAYASDDY